MFFSVFITASIACMGLLMFLDGLAELRADAPPPTPTNWWALSIIAICFGVVLGLMAQGIASFF